VAGVVAVVELLVLLTEVPPPLVPATLRPPVGVSPDVLVPGPVTLVVVLDGVVDVPLACSVGGPAGAEEGAAAL
jgi:hypothetical protein